MSETVAPVDAGTRIPSIPPSDPSASNAALALNAQLEQVSEVSRQHVQQCAAEIRGLIEPLTETSRQAADVHREAAARAALSEGAPGDKDLWQRVSAYRDAIRDRVLDPLASRLADPNPGDAIGRAWLGMLQTLANLGSTVDTEVRLPEHPSLFDPAEGDSAWHKTRKFELRSRRKLQAVPHRFANGFRSLIGREPRPQGPRSRAVPARAVVDSHLQVRLPTLLRPAHDATQEVVARHVAALEDALTEWTNASLEAEADLDRAEFHRPDSLPHALEPEAEEVADQDREPAERPALEAIAAALQQALDAAASADFALPLDESTVVAESQALPRDIERAGTFLLNPRQHRLPPANKSAAATIRQRQQAWSAWHQQVSDRLELNRRLIAFRQDLRKVEEAFLQRVTAATIEPVFNSFQTIKDRLRSAQADTEQACAAGEETAPTTELVRKLRAIQTRTLRHLQSAWRDLPGLVSSDQALAEPGLPEWQAIENLVKRLPDVVSVHTRQPDDEPEVQPGRRTVEVDLQQIARDALSLPLPHQLADHAPPLRRRVIDVWTATEKVQDIVRFNLGAALDELEARDAGEHAAAGTGDDAAVVEESAEPSPVAAARQLMVDGLRRAADTLTELEQSLWEPWQQFADAVFETLHDDWQALQRRSSAEAVIEERWLGFRTRTARRVERSWQRAEEQWQRVLTAAGRGLSVGSRRLKRLVKRGQEAVGVSETTEEESAASLDAIAEVRQLHAALPLVYRRLFAFEPLSEPSLFEGRSRDLVRVRKHFARWQEGQHAGVLMLPTPLGSGRTSFLNVLAASVFDKCDVHRLDLTGRCLDPDRFAAQLGKAIGLDLEEALTLDQLESQLVSLPRRDPPFVCLIDNLEHCLLRTIGGMDQIERVLIFLSRTDTSVYWVAAIGDLAWQFVRTTAPAAAGLVAEYAVEPLDRKALQDAILNRHRRSGMPLRFAMPAQPSALLRQRLRRVRTAHRRQALLQELYFDGLFRLAEGSVMLAMFYWLRSADFTTEHDVLTIKPVQPLNFRFLGTFDLARSFTLKTFMLHNTLTPEEHARVLRLSDDDGTFLLESLLNQRIIEPVQREARVDKSVGQPRIVPGAQYRIRPLMLQPVAEHLRTRHIIY